MSPSRDLISPLRASCGRVLKYPSDVDLTRFDTSPVVLHDRQAPTGLEQSPDLSPEARSRLEAARRQLEDELQEWEVEQRQHRGVSNAGTALTSSALPMSPVDGKRFWNDVIPRGLMTMIPVPTVPPPRSAQDASGDTMDQKSSLQERGAVVPSAGQQHRRVSPVFPRLVPAASGDDKTTTS